MKRKFSVTVLLLSLILVAAFSGCQGSWKKLYTYYVKDSTETINAQIKSIENDNGAYWLRLTVDADDYKNRYGTEEKSEDGLYKWMHYVKFYNENRFFVCEENGKILEENGFFENIVEDTLITLTMHTYFGSIRYFIIYSVQIEDKIYLDYETGKENWLNYIREKM